MNGIDWDSICCDVTWCWWEDIDNQFPPGITHGSSRSVFQSQPAAIIVWIEDFFLLYLLMPMKKERSENERTCLFVSVVLCTHIIQLVHLKGKLIFFRETVGDEWEDSIYVPRSYDWDSSEFIPLFRQTTLSAHFIDLHPDMSHKVC